MIAGLVRPDGGQVTVAGADPHRQPGALRNIGAVLEGNRNLYWRLTPRRKPGIFWRTPAGAPQGGSPSRAGTAGPVWAAGEAQRPGAKALPGGCSKRWPLPWP